MARVMTGMVRHPPNGRPKNTHKYSTKGEVVMVNAVLEIIVMVVPMIKDFLTPILSIENPTSRPYIEVKLPITP
jgi:hypothetical protein